MGWTRGSAWKIRCESLWIYSWYTGSTNWSIQCVLSKCRISILRLNLHFLTKPQVCSPTAHFLLPNQAARRCEWHWTSLGKLHSPGALCQGLEIRWEICGGAQPWLGGEGKDFEVSFEPCMFVKWFKNWLFFIEMWHVLDGFLFIEWCCKWFGLNFKGCFKKGRVLRSTSLKENLGHVPKLGWNTDESGLAARHGRSLHTSLVPGGVHLCILAADADLFHPVLQHPRPKSLASTKTKF